MNICHAITWHLEKSKWQEMLDNLGYNMTSLSCMLVYMPEIKVGFVFFKGREGKFMFMTAHDGDKITPYVHPSNVFKLRDDE
jgi:hypothetical protein